MTYVSNNISKLFVHQLVPFTLIISLIAICIVLIAEFYFNLLPCKLCVYQRFSYIAVIVFSVFRPFGELSYSEALLEIESAVGLCSKARSEK